MDENPWECDDEDFDENSVNPEAVSDKDDTDYFLDDSLCVFVDNDGDTLLHIAIIIDREDLANKLIDELSSWELLRPLNKLRQSVLHLAVLIGNATLCRKLLVAGADIEARDLHGNTALHLASRKGRVEVAETLLKPVTYSETKKLSYQVPYQRIPQNLGLRNFDGMTCFHIAADNSDLEMMKLLLRKGADINARFLKDGKTCVHHFVECNKLTLLRYVISRDDVNLNVRTYAGYTPLDVASLRGFGDVEYALLIHEAKRSKTTVRDSVDDSSLSDESSKSGDESRIS